MAERSPKGRHKGGMDPAALRPEDLARLLARASGKPIDVARIQADLAGGAPANADGTVNLVHYAAWLVQETTRGGSD